VLATVHFDFVVVNMIVQVSASCL